MEEWLTLPGNDPPRRRHGLHVRSVHTPAAPVKASPTGPRLKALRRREAEGSPQGTQGPQRSILCAPCVLCGKFGSEAARPAVAPYLFWNCVSLCSPPPLGALCGGSKFGAAAAHRDGGRRTEPERDSWTQRTQSQGKRSRSVRRRRWLTARNAGNTKIDPLRSLRSLRLNRFGGGAPSGRALPFRFFG